MTETIDRTDVQQQPSTVGVGSLGGRVALVTGGTRGIGASVAQALASHGATIGAGFSGNLERAEEFAASFAGRFDVPISLHRGNVHGRRRLPSQRRQFSLQCIALRTQLSLRILPTAPHAPHVGSHGSRRSSSYSRWCSTSSCLSLSSQLALLMYGS